MAQIVRFVPLEGVPDADARGAGSFHWDDGKVDVLEDPEMADLVKSYQDDLPGLEQLHASLPGGLNALPDMRLASNDPGFALTPEQQAMTSAAPTTAPPAAPATRGASGGWGDVDAPAPAAPGEWSGSAGVFRPGMASATPVSAPATPQRTGSDMPAPPSDASRAADLHRMAGDQALRGKVIPGQKAGYVPGSRTGVLDPAIAKRQADERRVAGDTLATETEKARQAEADDLRKAALGEAMKISVQKAEQQRIDDEAKAKAQRLKDERKRLNDEPIDRSFAQGNHFAQALAVLGSAFLGATGSDAGLRMIQNNIDGYVDQQLKIRGSKLQALAEELDSEEQAAAGAKAKLYALVEKEATNSGKLYDAAKIEHQTPAVLAEIKAQRVANEQAYERESLGKSTENYQQGRAGGRTGPDLAAAAKEYEAANKLAPEDEAKATAGLERAEVPDFIARMEGLSDAEHALNEIDSNVGIQRDAAGNVSNQKEIRSGNIEGAGFFGGRTPDSFSSEKGAALSREQRRLVQAQVKANSGAAATDAEREEYGKNLPLTDEKDFVNSTTEERRRWQKNYAKAVSLYGKERVDGYMGKYRGTRAGINAQRGQVGNSGSARGRTIEIDDDDQGREMR